MYNWESKTTIMNKFCLAIIATVLCVACVTDGVDNIQHNEDTSNKIHNWGDSAAQGRLMVRLTDSAESISVEGIALEVEPLFPTTTGNEKLDRWMLVHFDDELLVSALRNRIEKIKSALAEE